MRATDHRFPVLRHRALVACCLLAGYLFMAEPAATAEPQPSGDVPVIDGEAGPCSVDLTVVDAAGQPVYGATVDAHISFGFLGLHKLDVEIGTNEQGRARIVGLPDSEDDAFYFEGVKDAAEGLAFYNPGASCHAQHFLVLHQR